MDDMQAFERLVAAEAQVEAGPSRPTDVAAVVRAVATQSSRWRLQPMFSATKFVVAGAIVALFGGFLLAGVLTSPGMEQLPAAVATSSMSPDADPTPETSAAASSIRADIIPGVELVTVEIEPGVSQVVSDGTRDMAAQRGRYVAGQDGSVWVLQSKQFFRIGDAATHEWSNKGANSGGYNADDIEVAADGVVWWADPDGDGLKSFDGEGWTLQRKTPEGVVGKVDEVEVLADGTVLASWRLGDGTDTQRKLAHLGGAGWDVLGDVPDRGKVVLQANDLDNVWLLADSARDGPVLHRGAYDLGTDAEMDLAAGPKGDIRSMDQLETGGALWLMHHDSLVAFDGSDWSTYDIPDDFFIPDGWTSMSQAAPDGSVWLEVCSPATEEPAPCYPVRFDGATFSAFEGLTGLSLLPVAFAQDGTGVLARNETGLYVIDTDDLTTVDVELEPTTVEEPSNAEPKTATEYLPGVEVVTEEVEPGVYQVLADGERAYFGQPPSFSSPRQ